MNLFDYEGLTVYTSKVKALLNSVKNELVPNTRKVNSKPLSSDITLSASDVSALPSTGGTLTGDLRIKNPDSNFGTKINLGDGDYVHFYESPADDCLEIKAKKINFVLSDTSNSNFTINTNIVSDAGKSMGGKSVQPTTGPSVTAGQGTEIFNDYASRLYANSKIHIGNVASGNYSHAEGTCTTAVGQGAHSEGYGTYANGDYAHSEGYYTFCDCSYGGHAEGKATIAVQTRCVIPLASYTQNTITIDTNNELFNSSIFSKIKAGMEIYIWNYHYNDSSCRVYSISTVDTSAYTITLTEMLPSSSFVVKWAVIPSIRETYKINTITAVHSEGQLSVSFGTNSHAEGFGTLALGDESHASGYETVARGSNSYSGGDHTIAYMQNQMAIGEYNKASDTASDVFIIGYGRSSARSNCFRVTGNTGVYAKNYNTGGADYAEFFEWLDGNKDNEDRRGLFVTLDGEYIRLANSSDIFILGIISANPSVVGDVYDDQWKGMYLCDIYGSSIMEDEDHQKLNPDYDPSQTYIPRTKRPEWGCVGMMGKLVARDDGTCEVNGYAKVGEHGEATLSKTATKYRVMSRLDESHVRLLVLANS